MSDWTQAVIVLPVDLQAAGNRLGALFDPDSGGAETFGACLLSPTGAAPATHVCASTAIEVGYLPALADAALMQQSLTALATARGRPVPQQADCDAFVGGAVVRVEADPLAVIAEMGLQRL